MRITLFDWTAGGHHPRYLRRFAEALGDTCRITVAAPDVTLRGLADLDISHVSLASPRPALDYSRRLAPQNKELARIELDLLARVAATTPTDHLVHMYADPVIRRLVSRPPLGVPLTLFLFRPRAMYKQAYECSLSARETLRAWFLESLVRRWSRRPDAHALLTLEEAAARWWTAHGVRAYWIPEPPVPPAPNFDQERSGCILYGALAPQKGIGLLADAVSLRRPEFPVVIAGSVEPGYQATLEDEIRRMRGAGAEVELQPGYLPEDQGLRMLAGARCALLPYPRHYGMSRVLLDACAARTPVIVHDWGLPGHLVRKHKLGLAVDCTDARAFRRALDCLCAEDFSPHYSADHAQFVEAFSPAHFRRAATAPFTSGPCGATEAGAERERWKTAQL